VGKKLACWLVCVNAIYRSRLEEYARIGL